MLDVDAAEGIRAAAADLGRAFEVSEGGLVFVAVDACFVAMAVDGGHGGRRIVEPARAVADFPLE